MNFPARSSIDRNASARLAVSILKLIRSHYFRRPLTPATTYEVLDALALTVASVLSKDNPREIRDWFEALVDANLAQIAHDLNQRSKGVRQ
jgi:hypothetical protein